MTECNQNEFAFAPHFSRQVSVRFDERQLSTEGGGLLLRETDRKIGLLSRVSKCFSDHRRPVWIVHELNELLAQRIYGLALGYEDVNDHEELRRDPLLAVLAGKRRLQEPLAGKSTLNRLELTPAGSPLNDRYHKITYSTEALDALLVDIFLEAHAKAPRQIVLDLDVTDTPLYGNQEERFFHGYYNEYLSAVIHFLRRASVVCAAASLQPGCQRRQPGGGGAHRQTDSPTLAQGGHHLACRLGLLPRRADGLVRTEQSRLCVWPGT
jgi:Transposase DDE domain group 1